MLLLTEPTLFFLNLNLPSPSKNALAGRVKNWAELVNKSITDSDTKKSLQANANLKPPRPMSTALSVTGDSDSVATAPPRTESTAFTEYTAVTGSQADKQEVNVPRYPDDEMVGGFDDDEMDDEMERTAALLNKKQSVRLLFEK